MIHGDLNPQYQRSREKILIGTDLKKSLQLEFKFEI
jgi:hypothetical protein